MGTLDFAGGTVVHINSGIAALVTCLMLGKRNIVKKGLVSEPHNIPQVVIGAGLLWFGWFGFNAGSGLAADGLAASAFLVTHIASAMAAFTWAIDRLENARKTFSGWYMYWSSCRFGCNNSCFRFC